MNSFPEEQFPHVNDDSVLQKFDEHVSVALPGGHVERRGSVPQHDAWIRTRHQKLSHCLHIPSYMARCVAQDTGIAAILESSLSRVKVKVQRAMKLRTY